MKGKILPLIIVGLMIFGVFYLIKGKKQPVMNPNLEGNLVLYYSDTCPHCEDVKKFIDDKGVENKLNLVQKEVNRIPVNHDEFVKQAAICGIAGSNLGVPLLWNGNGCNFGTEEIKTFLQKQLDEK